MKLSNGYQKLTKHLFSRLRLLRFMMDRHNKNLLVWNMLYWIACVNTIVAIGFTLFTEAYHYSYAISATKLALICACLQFFAFKYYAGLPFYQRFGVISLSAFVYLSFIEVGSNLLRIDLKSFGFYLLLVFLLTLPLVLVSYFVSFRLQRYDNSANNKTSIDT